MRGEDLAKSCRINPIHDSTKNGAPFHTWRPSTWFNEPFSNSRHTFPRFCPCWSLKNNWLEEFRQTSMGAVNQSTSRFCNKTFWFKKNNQLLFQLRKDSWGVSKVYSKPIHSKKNQKTLICWSRYFLPTATEQKPLEDYMPWLVVDWLPRHLHSSMTPVPILRRRSQDCWHPPHSRDPEGHDSWSEADFWTPGKSMTWYKFDWTNNKRHYLHCVSRSTVLNCYCRIVVVIFVSIDLRHTCSVWSFDFTSVQCSAKWRGGLQ